MDPGEKLGNKYEIQRVIGSGEFGQVYRALDMNLNRDVAIKELHPDIPQDKYQEYRKRFKLESEVQGQFNHPHIVHVYELIKLADGTLYLVMEYVDGGNLSERITKAPLPITEAVEICLKMFEALGKVHTHPLDIVHRDVKPSNILLTGEGIPKLTDFGIAQLGGASSRTWVAQSHPGTPLYMSPEQERTTGYLGGASDIYSLGCVLFEMLTGKPYKKARNDDETLRQLRPEVSPCLNKAVMRLLEETPQARPRDGKDLERALKPLRPILMRVAYAAVFLLLACLVSGALLQTVWHQLPGILSTTVGTPVIETPAPTLTSTLELAETPTAFPPRPPTVAETDSPTSTPTHTPIPPSTPNATQTRTSSPTATRTPPPTLTPTRQPTLAATETPVPAATFTHTPVTAVIPQRSAPAQGSTHNNPINFSWTGTLYSGQSYQVTAYSTRTGYRIQSPALSTDYWTVNLPGEHYGEWKWSVAVVQNNAIVVTSSEGIFWFDPNIGGGGGNGGGDPTATPVVIVTPAEP